MVMVKVSPGASVSWETAMEVMSGPSLSLEPPPMVKVVRAGDLLQQLVLVQFWSVSLP